jgi:hypothetical protein
MRLRRARTAAAKKERDTEKMRISITRTELTILTTSLITLIALALAPAWGGAAFGQESTAVQSQNSTGQTSIRTIGDGQPATIEGIVIKRNSDTFTLRGSDGAETVVALTDRTTVKTVRKGLFRKDKSSGAGYILRGLRLKAEGVGNPDGQLVASSIRFDEEYGSQDPAATNDTSEGRSKNRRAEIRVLVNKGIAPRTDSAEKTAVVPLTNQP